MWGRIQSFLGGPYISAVFFNYLDVDLDSGFYSEGTTLLTKHD